MSNPLCHLFPFLKSILIVELLLVIYFLQITRNKYNFIYLFIHLYNGSATTIKTTDTTDEDAVRPLRYYYNELSFCAVMLSLFRSFGENEKEVEDGDGVEDDEDVNDDNGTQGKINTQKHDDSDDKLYYLSLYLLLIEVLLSSLFNITLINIGIMFF